MGGTFQRLLEFIDLGLVPAELRAEVGEPFACLGALRLTENASCWT